MGRLFSLRYTELANEKANSTAVKPVAVFSCDGPCDLENMYSNFQKEHRKFLNSLEPAYGIKELETYCGGNPVQAQKQYIYYSCYSHSQADGGNARFLKDTPVRIYDDVDPNWWLANRGVDMYNMNAFDQSAMILLLNEAETEMQNLLTLMVTDIKLKETDIRIHGQSLNLLTLLNG